jgi:hypothetical protein
VIIFDLCFFVEFLNLFFLEDGCEELMSVFIFLLLFLFLFSVVNLLFFSCKRGVFDREPE